jgi:hypothetical protein
MNIRTLTMTGATLEHHRIATRERFRARIIDRLGMRPESERTEPYADTTEELERLLLLSMQND